MRPSQRILLSSLLVLACLTWIGDVPVAEAQQDIQVNSADPPTAPQGTVNLNVVIGGKGFKRGAQAKWFVTGTTNPGGVTVNSTTYISSSQLVANITVADDASTSLFDIQVQNSDGRTGKGIELFAVTKGRKGDSEPPPDPAIAYSTAGNLYVMNADGTNKTVVYNSSLAWSPDWSPDGKRLVFVTVSSVRVRGRNINNYGLSLMNVDGSGLCKLVAVNESALVDQIHPVWSPLPLADGREWIIYMDYSAQSASRDLFAVRADCTNPGTPVNLTNTTGQEWWPSWSRFANRLAASYTSGNDFGSSTVAVYDVSLVNGVPQLSNRMTLRNMGLVTTREALQPSWARISDRLAFSASGTTSPNPDANGGYDLWVTDLTYSGTYMLTPPADADEIHVSWSPDDTQMVMYNMADGWVLKIARRVNPDGTETWVRTQQMVYVPTGIGGMSWRRCNPCF